MNHRGFCTRRYRRGAARRTPAAAVRSLFFPHLSASIPTGKLNSTPANGEMAAINPITDSLPERDFTKRGSTGLFDIVVEKIPKKPARDSAPIPRGARAISPPGERSR